MPKAALYNTEGIKVGDVDLKDDVFGVPLNESLLHQAVVRHLANKRAGTAATKTRGLVRGGGRKPWRQKGIGRARVGSIRSPLWRGGGIVFGPEPCSYQQAMPRKMRRLALKSALSARAEEGNLIVIEELQLPEPKTKEAVKLLESLNVTGTALLVAHEEQPEFMRAVRNIPGISYQKVDSLNVYDVLAVDKVIMTKLAVAKIEEVLSNAKPS
ncbi:MAG: 50S ribosomal protein L4 [Thermacetogeniaceae bacterium]|jgi:large subunit ribosomal protein L4|nr:50S ribosomal protein L4 [Syntrophomonadaceae bacterium]